MYPHILGAFITARLVTQATLRKAISLASTKLGKIPLTRDSHHCVATLLVHITYSQYTAALI